MCKINFIPSSYLNGLPLAIISVCHIWLDNTSNTPHSGILTYRNIKVTAHDPNYKKYILHEIRMHMHFIYYAYCRVGRLLFPFIIQLPWQCLPVFSYRSYDILPCLNDISFADLPLSPVFRAHSEYVGFDMLVCMQCLFNVDKSVGPDFRASVYIVIGGVPQGSPLGLLLFATTALDETAVWISAYHSLYEEIEASEMCILQSSLLYQHMKCDWLGGVYVV